MSDALLTAMFVTIIALSFPLWSWTQMLTAVEIHEEWRHERRERQAQSHREVIADALASVPSIVDVTTAENGTQMMRGQKWIAHGFVPGAAQRDGGLA